MFIEYLQEITLIAIHKSENDWRLSPQKKKKTT